jgi:hypothetical protein
LILFGSFKINDSKGESAICYDAVYSSTFTRIKTGRYKLLRNHKTKILVFFTLSILLPAFLFAGKTTELSKKASNLKIGMSRNSVIKLLGPPTWARIPGDAYDFTLPDPRIKLELYWKNPGCSPVIVQFNARFKVTGWEEGRIYCGKDAYLFEPTEDCLCNKPGRERYCK